MAQENAAASDSRTSSVHYSETEAARTPRSHGNRLLKLGMPLAVLLLLVVFAAGMKDGILPVAALVAAVGMALTRPPLQKAVRGFWWIGIVAFLWLLITVIPMPLGNLGSERITYFGEMQRVLAERPPISAEDAETSETTSEETVAEADKGSSVWGRLSLNRAGTLRFIILLGLAWAMLWMGGAMSARQRRSFLHIVLIGGTLIAILGLLGRFVFPTNNYVWWLIPMNNNVGAQPFVNRNHFASFCAMLVPLGLCLTLAPNLRIPPLSSQQAASSHGELDESESNSDRRDRRSEGKVDKGRSVAAWRWFFGVCLAILVSAVVLSLSRGGMLAMVVGALAAASFWLRGHPVLATGATVVVVAVIMAFVFWPNKGVQERVRSLSDLDEASPLRIQMRNEAMAQWRDFPIVGGGAESFRTLYGVYRSKPGTHAPNYVENEYAQLLADLGSVGAVVFGLLGIGYLACLYGCLHRQSSRHRHKSSLLGGHLWTRSKRSWGDEFVVVVSAVAVGTVVVLLFHFTVDFSLRIPLNAALAGALLGMGMPLPEQPHRARRSFWLFRTVPYALAMVALVGASVKGGLHLDERSSLKEANVQELERALKSVPSYWYPWYQMARAYMFAAQESSNHQREEELRKFGMRCFETAAKYNKTHYTIQHELAKARFHLAGRVTEEVRNAFHRAARLAPERQEIWNEWLRVEMSNGGVEAAWHVAETAEDLAPKSNAFAVWKRILKKLEDDNELSRAYEVIRNITGLAPENHAMLRKRSQMEMRMDMKSAAAASLAKAAEQRPNNHQIWMELGTLELKRGNDLKANEAFTKAIRIKPNLRSRVDKIWGQRRQPRSSQDGGTDDETLFDF